jgi:hypothetical protein
MDIPFPVKMIGVSGMSFNPTGYTNFIIWVKKQIMIMYLGLIEFTLGVDSEIR